MITVNSCLIQFKPQFLQTTLMCYGLFKMTYELAQLETFPNKASSLHNDLCYVKFSLFYIHIYNDFFLNFCNYNLNKIFTIS